MAKKKVSFLATKKIKKPVDAKFRRSDRSIAKFRAKKIITKPIRISFYTSKKRRKNG